MNILVLNWQDIRHPLAGGAEVHCQEIFSRIAALGYRVTLACCAFPGAPPREVIDGITVVREGSRALFNFHVPGLYRRLRAEQAFDVVVDDMNKIPFFTPLFVQEPVCLQVHHLFHTSIFREADPLSASYVWATERMALSYYRRKGIPVAVVSPSTEADLLGRGFRRDRVHLIPLAVRHDRFVPKIAGQEENLLVGYVGRIKRYKGIEILLRAFVLVRVTHPAARLVIVGDGDDRPRLERLAETLGLGASVQFTGFVPEEEKVRWLQRMQVMATPSSKEGWGLTVTEANACGTPVVASDVPGLRDAVVDGETGILFPYGDEGELAAALTRLLSDDAERGRMAERAQLFASGFSWEEAATRTLALLEQTAGR